MQQAIDILDEMMEERTPYKEDMQLHKTLGYEVCHGGYIALEEAKSRIQALGESRDDRFKEIMERKSESAYYRGWKEGQAKAMEAMIDFEKNKLVPIPIIIPKGSVMMPPLPPNK